MDLSLSLDSLLTTGGSVTVLMDETERIELTSVTQPHSLSLIHLLEESTCSLHHLP